MSRVRMCHGCGRRHDAGPIGASATLRYCKFCTGLKRLIEITDWVDRAACLGADPEIFFPERRSPAPAITKFCNICPVQAECLEVGMEERYGVWGGTTPEQREAMKRRARMRRSATSSSGAS